VSRTITDTCDFCDTIATVTLPDTGGGWCKFSCACGDFMELVGEDEIEAALKEREQASN
jgi:hypothetical protein